MKNDLSVESLLEFLETAERLGFFAKATAAAMRSTVGRVFGSLDQHETGDVTALQLDEVLRRFANKSGGVSPGSLRTYRSRLDVAVRNFVEYRRDPVNYKPHGRAPSESKQKPKAERLLPASRDRSASSAGVAPIQPLQPPAARLLTYPFPLRSDLTVTISNVPRDLKSAEAERIGAFLKALTEDFKP